MRRAAAVGVMAAVVLAGTSPAAGTWSDAAIVTGKALTTTSLTTAPLDCEEVTVLLANSARIYWTPSTSPASLVYTARLVGSGANLDVTDNSSVVLTPSLLSTLFGTTVTVRVTGTLPGNPREVGWITQADKQVAVGPAGLIVNCVP